MSAPRRAGLQMPVGHAARGERALVASNRHRVPKMPGAQSKAAGEGRRGGRDPVALPVTVAPWPLETVNGDERQRWPLGCEEVPPPADQVASAFGRCWRILAGSIAASRKGYCNTTARVSEMSITTATQPGEQALS
ncbi:hypothetical protein AAII07_41420 [Microvirga sp. 0TCS3.31]